MLQIADRVKETTTTTGTGAITLAGAMTGFRAFSAVCSVGDTIYYALQAVDGNGLPTGAWEVGLGTYSAASTLTRTTVLASSNAGSAITLAGTTQVWGDLPAVVASALTKRFQLTAANEPVPTYPDDQVGYVDGNFDFWDVNTTFSLVAATDTYTADMWICNAGTSGAATVSQNTPAVGSEPAWISRPRKFRLSYQQTTNATTSPTIGQKLENVMQYNSQSITISGTFAAAVAGTDIVGVQATQNFGTGGTPSAAVVTSKTVAWALTTSEQQFSVRLDIPSISGKTLGTNGDDNLRIDFLLATGASYTVYASQVQIDLCSPNASSDTAGKGGAPQPFRYRGLQAEAARLARFIRYLGNGSTGFVGHGLGIGFTTTGANLSYLFTAPMRGAPAITFSNIRLYNGVSNPVITGVTFSDFNGTEIIFTAAVASGLTAGNAVFLEGSGSAGYLMFDARL